MRSPQHCVGALVCVVLLGSCGRSGPAPSAGSPSAGSPSAVPLGHGVVRVDESANGRTVSIDLGDRLVVELHGQWQEPTSRGQQGPTGQDRVLVRQAGSPSTGTTLATARFLAVAPGRDEVTASQPASSGGRFAVTVVVR